MPGTPSSNTARSFEVSSTDGVVVLIGLDGAGAAALAAEGAPPTEPDDEPDGVLERCPDGVRVDGGAEDADEPCVPVAAAGVAELAEDDIAAGVAALTGVARLDTRSVAERSALTAFSVVGFRAATGAAFLPLEDGSAGIAGCGLTGEYLDSVRLTENSGSSVSVDRRYAEGVRFIHHTMAAATPRRTNTTNASSTPVPEIIQRDYV